MLRPVRISAVEPLDGFRVRLQFTDDSCREIDLEPFLHGPVFEPIRENEEVFRSAKVDRRLGTICWSNGADIDPDVLYRRLTPAWMEEERAAG
jgi:hypothetical protein